MKIKDVKFTLQITCTNKEADNLVTCALQSDCRAMSHIKDRKLIIAGKSVLTWNSDRTKFLELLPQYVTTLNADIVV